MKNRLLYGMILSLIVIMMSCEKDPYINEGTYFYDGNVLYQLAEPVADIDGNVYKTVKLGNQVWMAENLRTTRYADGAPIPLVTATTSSAAVRYYPNNNSANVTDFGYLYSWYAVMKGSSSSDANPSGVQGICPDGWHVPSDAEWTELTNYVESQSQYLCGKCHKKHIAKALASGEGSGWASSYDNCAVGNDPSANNATGFSARPAGFGHGSYYGDFGRSALFWSTGLNWYSSEAYLRFLSYSSTLVYSGINDKYVGYSVRCVRN